MKPDAPNVTGRFGRSMNVPGINICEHLRVPRHRGQPRVVARSTDAPHTKPAPDDANRPAVPQWPGIPARRGSPFVPERRKARRRAAVCGGARADRRHRRQRQSWANSGQPGESSRPRVRNPRRQSGWRKRPPERSLRLDCFRAIMSGGPAIGRSRHAAGDREHVRHGVQQNHLGRMPTAVRSRPR